MCSPPAAKGALNREQQPALAEAEHQQHEANDAESDYREREVAHRTIFCGKLPAPHNGVFQPLNWGEPIRTQAHRKQNREPRKAREQGQVRQALTSGLERPVIKVRPFWLHLVNCPQVFLAWNI